MTSIFPTTFESVDRSESSSSIIQLKAIDQMYFRVFNNYSSSPNGILTRSEAMRARGITVYVNRGHEGKRNNCLRKI